MKQVFQQFQVAPATVVVHSPILDTTVSGGPLRSTTHYSPGIGSQTTLAAILVGANKKGTLVFLFVASGIKVRSNCTRRRVCTPFQTVV